MITRFPGVSLLALALLLAAPAQAELSSYRLELLVFQHLEGVGEPVLVDRLPDFENLPALGDAVPPDGITLQPEMSPALADAWRRLRLSATFRPLLYASWDQDNTQFQPPMRLHGEEVLHEEIRFPGDWVMLDLATDDPLAAYRQPFYRLDGHASLRRSRFLHVDLDLELRDLAPADAIATIVTRDAVTPAPAEMTILDRSEATADVALVGAEPPTPGPWQVERLRESRQVRVGELHYFDSPVLGVLARVSAVENPR